MAADKAAPKAAEQQDAALRQLLASMRCKQYKRAREACTAALAAGAEPKLMKDYAAVRRDGVRIDTFSLDGATSTYAIAATRAPTRRPSTPSSRSAAAARTTWPPRPRTAPAAAASSSSSPSCC